MISKVKLNGLILPTTMILMASSLAITRSYYNWLDAKMKELDFRIAVVKAPLVSLTFSLLRIGSFISIKITRKR